MDLQIPWRYEAEETRLDMRICFVKAISLWTMSRSTSAGRSSHSIHEESESDSPNSSISRWRLRSSSNRSFWVDQACSGSSGIFIKRDLRLYTYVN